jgi:hypothetical protein
MLSELHDQLVEIAAHDNAFAENLDSKMAHRYGLLTAAEIVATLARYAEDDAELWLAHKALMAVHASTPHQQKQEQGG